MTFGYEVEYFLSRNGQILKTVPQSYPRDGSQKLIEARSQYYVTPKDTEQSLLREIHRLSAKTKRDGFEIVQLNHHDGETAGFHVHFGSNKHIDMPMIINELDLSFEREILSAKRLKSLYRMKPYGFEYRSLPATVSSTAVTNIIERLKTK